RAGMRSLSAPEGAPRPPAGSSPVDLAAYAERAPQEARLLALNGLLGEWGEAVLHGDAVRARDRLRAVSAIAESLERRGGDATLADAVRVIRTHAGDSVTVRKLAMAHSAYTRAQRHLDQRVADSAHAAFEVAHAYAGASPALAQWAAYSRGVALFYGGARGVEALFRQVAARADPVRHPALAGRAHWSLGTLLLRRGAYAEARRRYLEAARLFRRAGEREHLGAVQAMETEALFGMGDEDTGFASAYRAIETLHPYRQGSLWLHNLLYVTAQAATARGLRRAALRVHDEGVSVAAHVRPAVHAEALLTRALARTAAGDREGAARDVEASRALIASLPPTFQRTWLEQDLRLAYAELSIRTHPALALAALDSVVSFFGSGRVRPRLNAALPRRAEANLVLGDTAAAVADLSRVAAVLDTLSGAEGAGVRASMLETARQVSDRLAMLHVRAGQASRALAALERGRASFGPTGAIAQRGEGGSLRGPPGEIAVEYALVGDTLLVFTLADTAVRLHTRVVDRHAMLRRIDRLRSALEVRQPLDSVSGDLAVLYDQLVRPVRSRLGEGVSLVLIADGEVAGVPFAALRDGARARYLVQDHTLRFANTLAEAAHPERRPEQPSRDVLFVADPAFEPREHPGLQRLPGLAADTRRIAQGYPGAVVLTGAEARRDALATALKQAGIFHFAGHAVFDDQRPVRSYLVLAPGGEAPGRLTAAEIARMDLGHLRLVVLSACQTQRSTSGRSGGFAGLSGAMLAAGAGGVVGSLWRVNDALTRELMVGFHHAYRGSGDGADALRQAQLRLLDADDPALRSPAAWAGFRYAGG
ncbi:MAG TPA: CHAT domain-containing protein, partial [Longimicrobiaceae bacterium]|nr:CHAT domain-containing protein [Longimicrobiaceae bacterium]